MSRTVLAIGAVLVFGVAIGIWILARPGDGAHASPDRPSLPAPVAAEGETPRPELPANTATTMRTRAHVGDVVVRDHRTGTPPPPSDDVASGAPPKRDRELPSKLTYGVTRGIKRVLDDCARHIPVNERTGPVRLQGTIDVAIKDHVASIHGSDLAIVGSAGPASETAKQCVAQKSLGLQTQAPDQADLESYSIEVSFRVP